MPAVSKRRSIISWVAFGVVALGAAWLFLNRQYVIDQINVWQFQPSAQISALASESGMSDRGRFLYLASRPQLDDNKQFNNYCPQSESGSAVLGCYVNDRIYLFNVDNPQLSGIKITTAAHEMLHAAYARLSAAEKTRVDTMVEKNYQDVKDTPGLAETMAVYEKSEPGEADNELHSILGTQIAKLTPDLEKYYKQYFDDRSKSVAAYDGYSAVFSELKKRADNLEAQLNNLKSQIETQSSDYSQAVGQFQDDVNEFNVRARQSGGFASQAEFDAARSNLVARSSRLESERDAINSAINRYNQLINEYNDIAAKNKTLNDSINSNLPSAPQV